MNETATIRLLVCSREMHPLAFLDFSGFQRKEPHLYGEGRLPAREIRWPSVFSGTRNARAISGVVRPPIRARRFAASISHAPGLSGVPSSGQTSRAVTSASRASSSAMPISWVTRAIAAMRRVDSIFHTASIVLVTSLMQPRLRRSGARSLRPLFERPRGNRTSRESGELRPPRGWTSEHAWPIRWPLPASGPG
jgi:hypothetical protein